MEADGLEGPSASEFSIEILDRYYVIKAPSRDAAEVWVSGLRERQSTSPTSADASGAAPGAAGSMGSREGRMNSIYTSAGADGMAEQLATVAVLTKAGAMPAKFNHDNGTQGACCRCVLQ